MLVIPGSRGEGGGQILRSSLTLALITGTRFRIEQIRAKRQRPGLRRQHLTAVRAAREVSGGSVTGDRLGSTELTFDPGPVKAGSYTFDVGTAGSTSLVLQAVLPALALAEDASTVEVRGGTHNPYAPPFDFLARTLFPLVAKMGPLIDGTLHRPGFYPAGGGHAHFTIHPTEKLRPLELAERGPIVRRAITATVSRLPPSIGKREVATLSKILGWAERDARVVEVADPVGPGNFVTVDLESEQLTEVFTGFGAKGVRAEQVARSVADEVQRYLGASVPVGKHLADQLLLWLALAGGGWFLTVEPTQHTRTHIDLLQTFLEVEIRCDQTSDEVWRIEVTPRAAG